MKLVVVMAIVGRINELKLLQKSPLISIQSCSFSFAAARKPFFKKFYAAIGLATGGLGILVYALEKSVQAYDFSCKPPHQHWSHKGILNALDHASIRRGYEVYRNVCSACHSMEFIPFRALVDVAYTEEEMKQIASEIMVKDGPDDTGAYFERPAKLFDYFPDPYPNAEAAAHANNGKAPPDLSLMVLARHHAEDYVFSLLNGYTEPPAGISLEPNTHYNVYFEGSIIAMAPPLYDGIIEYSDGTPATQSQLAKDVSTFLVWSSEPHHDKRKLYVLKGNVFLLTIIPILMYITRYRFISLRNRGIFRYAGNASK